MQTPLLAYLHNYYFPTTQSVSQPAAETDTLTSHHKLYCTHLFIANLAHGTLHTTSQHTHPRVSGFSTSPTAFLCPNLALFFLANSCHGKWNFYNCVSQTMSGRVCCAIRWLEIPLLLHHVQVFVCQSSNISAHRLTSNTWQSNYLENALGPRAESR